MRLKLLFILLPLGCFSQDLTPAQLDSLVSSTWNGQTVYIDDTIRCNKIEVRTWIFWKEVKEVKYLLRRWKDDRRTRIDFYIDEKRRRYTNKELVRVRYYDGEWVENN